MRRPVPHRQSTYEPMQDRGRPPDGTPPAHVAGRAATNDDRDPALAIDGRVSCRGRAAPPPGDWRDKWPTLWNVG
ncbi:MAG: hypothetical protein AAF663_09330, partial [Planctomycetota bacterium]